MESADVGIVLVSQRNGFDCECGHRVHLTKTDDLIAFFFSGLMKSVLVGFEKIASLHPRGRKIVIGGIEETKCS